MSATTTSTTTTSTTSEPTIRAGVNCLECRRRLAALGGEWKASEVYDVGNPGLVDFGHHMYHTRVGQLALCHAAVRPGVTV
jgi:hypothetical protein